MNIFSIEFLKKIYLNVISFYFDFRFIISRAHKPFFIIVIKNGVSFKYTIKDNIYFYSEYLHSQKFDKIIIKSGFFEKTKYLRYHLVSLNNLLNENGLIEINYYSSYSDYVGGQLIRPFSFLMYEIGLCLSSRMKISDIRTNGKYRVVSLKKIINTTEFSINKWSFGIISNGSQQSILNIERIVREICNLNIPFFEILICGPGFLQQHFKECKVLSDDDLLDCLRPPVTIKKNRIIANAKYENLVIQHDRIFYSSSWFNDLILELPFEFDLVCPIILDDNFRRFRIMDWMVYSGDISIPSKSFGRLMSRNKWNVNMYIDGGFLMGKRSVFLNVLMNENLSWGECEDLHYSRILFENGYLIQPLCNVINYSLTHRNKPSILSKIFSKMNNI